MKKFAAILLTVALSVATGLCMLACGGDEKSRARVEYTVTFDYNYDGAPETVTQTVKSGEKATKPADPPARTDYVFDGWYFGATPFVIEDTAVTSDMDLWAHWSEKKNEVIDNRPRITFKETEGVTYLFENGRMPERAEKGSTLEFSLEISPFCVGAPEVKENLFAVKADKNNVYRVTVEGDTEISVSGVAEDKTFFAGMGTRENPYIIQTAGQWKTFAEMVNADGSRMGEKYYRLGADLDFRGYEIPVVKYFTGTFDGNGKTLSRYVIDVVENLPGTATIEDMTDTVNVGLFGRLAQATVKNLTLEDFEVSVNTNGIAYMGGLAGDAVSSNIYGVNVRGSVSYTNNGLYYFCAGGLVGSARTIASSSAYMNTEIFFCNADVTIHSDFLAYAGGLIGRSSGEDATATVLLANCAVTADVRGGHFSGGIAAWLGAYSSVTDCAVFGYVEASNDNTVSESIAAGIAGYVAEKEVAIVGSFTAARTVATAGNPVNATRADVVGSYGDANLDTAYANDSLVYKTYYAPNGKLTVDTVTHDLTTSAGAASLLGWQASQWNFTAGELPVANTQGSAALSGVNFTLQFPGESITNVRDGASDEEVAAGITHTDSIPYPVARFTPVSQLGNENLLSVRDGILAVSGTSGNVSTGLYVDAAHDTSLPAAFLINGHSMSEGYVGFENKTEIEGKTFYFHVSGVDYTLTFGQEIVGTVGSGTDTYRFNYLYYGEDAKGQKKVLLMGTPTFVSDYAVTATFDGDKIEIPGLVKTGEDEYGDDITRENPVTALSSNAYTGVWYADSGDVYTFHAGGTGEILRGTTKASFTYAYGTDSVTVTEDDKAPVTFAYASDKLTADSTELSAFDMFRGEYASMMYASKTVSFDGKRGDYTVTKKTIGSGDAEKSVLAATKSGEETYYYFDDDGYLVSSDGEQYGVAGGVAGMWTNASYGYLLILNGITRYGYGYAMDNLVGSLMTYTRSGNTLTFYVENSPVYTATVSVRSGVTTVTAQIGYTSVPLALDDGLRGSWYASDDTAKKIEFSYGQVTIDGNTVPYTYVDGMQKVTFTVGSNVYVATQNEENTNILTLTRNGYNEGTFKQRDAFYGSVLVSDYKIATLSFNGLGELGEGAVVVTINGISRTLPYTVNAKGEAVITEDGKAFGTVAYSAEKKGYILTLAPSDASAQPVSLELGKDNDFTGVWAVMDFYVTVYVGLLDDSGNGKAVIDIGDGNEYNATVTYDPQNEVWMVAFAYGEGADEQTITFLFAIHSQYGLVLLTNQGAVPVYAPDVLCGMWYDIDANGRPQGYEALQFDGTGLTSQYIASATYMASANMGGQSQQVSIDFGYGVDEDGNVWLLTQTAAGYAQYARLDLATAANFATKYEQLIAEGYAPVVFTNENASIYLFVMPVYADALMNLSAVRDSSGTAYAFGLSMFYEAAYKATGYGFMQVGTGDNASLMAYRTDYASEDGTYFVVSAYALSDVNTPVAVYEVRVGADGRATISLHASVAAA